jgi:DNA-binding NtrC family response regulator
MAPARMPPNDGIPLGGPAARPVARAGLAPLEQQEYEMVREALTAERGFIRRAAARLGISHQALLRRLDKWPELRTPSIPPTPLP